MNLKKYLFVGAALMSVSFFAACSDDENEPQNPPVEEPDEPNGDDPEGPVSLEDQWNNTNTVTWPADTVINLTEHYTVPEGKTLIIKEGVQIIASTEGVGANLLPVEFSIAKELKRNLFFSLFLKLTGRKPIHSQVCGAVLLPEVLAKKC